MRGKLLLGLGLILGLVASRPASAGTVTVSYDLTGSVFNATSPLSINSAAFVNGTAIVTFSTNASNQIINGPITLDALDTVTVLSSGGLSTLGLSGNVDANTIGTSTSTLTGNVVAGGATGNLLVTGSIFCASSGACSALLGLPATTTLHSTVPTTLGALTFASLSTPISSSFEGTQPFALNIGATQSEGIINLVGHAFAVSTPVVPEPGTALLLVAGIAGLALSGRRKRS